MNEPGAPVEPVAPTPVAPAPAVPTSAAPVYVARRTRRVRKSTVLMAQEVPVGEAAPAPTVRCFRLDKEQDLVAIPGGIPTRAWIGDGTIRWIDQTAADPEALRTLLEVLGTPGPVIEHATDFEARITDAHAERDAAWLRIPVPASLGDDEYRFINVIALPGLLVTHHRRPMAQLDGLEAILVHAMPEGASTTTLVLEVLEEFSGEDLRLFVRTRSEVDALARRLDEGVQDVKVDEIAELMRRVDLLATVCEDHLLAVSLLPQLESQAFRSGSGKEHFAEVTTTLERYQQGLRRLERRLESLRAVYAAMLQESANARLRVLTVMSTVFLPLTLLASIYGMNFEHMPELKSPIGYPMVILAMVSIAAAQVWWYRRKGWLD